MSTLPKLTPVDPDRLLKGHEQITAATGLSSYDLSSIKRAGELLGDQPFTGRLTTTRRLTDWLARHPEFKPSAVWTRRSGHPGTGPGHRPAVAGKSGAPARSSAPQTASPASSARHSSQAA